MKPLNYYISEKLVINKNYKIAIDNFDDISKLEFEHLYQDCFFKLKNNNPNIIFNAIKDIILSDAKEIPTRKEFIDKFSPDDLDKKEIKYGLTINEKQNFIEIIFKDDIAAKYYPLLSTDIFFICLYNNELYISRYRASKSDTYTFCQDKNYQRYDIDLDINFENLKYYKTSKTIFEGVKKLTENI